jgi:hypothetical protein
MLIIIDQHFDCSIERSCGRSRRFVPCYMGICQSSECREFSGRCVLLLQRQEDAGFSRMDDRAMDLLASCNLKALSK